MGASSSGPVRGSAGGTKLGYARTATSVAHNLVATKSAADDASPQEIAKAVTRLRATSGTCPTSSKSSSSTGARERGGSKRSEAKRPAEAPRIHAHGEPGRYIIERDCLPVNECRSRDSNLMGSLRKGTFVEVLELGQPGTSDDSFEEDMRARIEEPPGWISLSYRDIFFARPAARAEEDSESALQDITQIDYISVQEMRRMLKAQDVDDETVDLVLSGAHITEGCIRYDDWLKWLYEDKDQLQADAQGGGEEAEDMPCPSWEQHGAVTPRTRQDILVAEIPCMTIEPPRTQMPLTDVQAGLRKEVEVEEAARLANTLPEKREPLDVRDELGNAVFTLGSVEDQPEGEPSCAEWDVPPSLHAMGLSEEPFDERTVSQEEVLVAGLRIPPTLVLAEAPPAVVLATAVLDAPRTSQNPLDSSISVPPPSESDVPAPAFKAPTPAKEAPNRQAHRCASKDTVSTEGVCQPSDTFSRQDTPSDGETGGGDKDSTASALLTPRTALSTPRALLSAVSGSTQTPLHQGTANSAAAGFATQSPFTMHSPTAAWVSASGDGSLRSKGTVLGDLLIGNFGAIFGAQLVSKSARRTAEFKSVVAEFALDDEKVALAQQVGQSLAAAMEDRDRAEASRAATAARAQKLQAEVQMQYKLAIDALKENSISTTKKLLEDKLKLEREVISAKACLVKAEQHCASTCNRVAELEQRALHVAEVLERARLTTDKLSRKALDRARLQCVCGHIFEEDANFCRMCRKHRNELRPEETVAKKAPKAQQRPLDVLDFHKASEVPASGHDVHPFPRAQLELRPEDVPQISADAIPTSPAVGHQSLPCQPAHLSADLSAKPVTVRRDEPCAPFQWQSSSLGHPTP